MNYYAKLLAVMCICCFSAFAARVHAEQITTILPIQADSDIREAAPDYAKGDRDIHIAKNMPEGDRIKVYLKFELPADFHEAASAALRIRPAVVYNPAWSLKYNVYGLKDSAPGNDWQDLVPGTYYGDPSGGITWNNAPANNTAGDGFTSDAAGPFGWFTTNGAEEGDTLVFSSEDLVDFINTDTDGIITLMIERFDTETASFDRFASSEHSTYGAPELELTYYKAPSEQAELIAAADSDIRETAPDYAKGDRDLLIAKNMPVGDRMKVYLKFDLPDDFHQAVSATLEITPSLVYNPLWTLKYNVYGLKDNAPGNNWRDLAPGNYFGDPYGGITWNNAPANNTEGDGFTEDALGPFGWFTTNGAAAGDTLVFSSQDLVDFINTDTDGVITLMLERFDTGTTAFDRFASTVNATYDPPRLVLHYVPGCARNLRGDLTGDCNVGPADLQILAESWLDSNEPQND